LYRKKTGFPFVMEVEQRSLREAILGGKTGADPEISRGAQRRGVSMRLRNPEGKHLLFQATCFFY
jgi:hypothetical protein